MPSEIAQQIVQQIFGDDKAKAIDSVNDALAALHSMQFNNVKSNLLKVWDLN